MPNEEGPPELLPIVILATEPKVNQRVHSTEIMLEQNVIEHPSSRLTRVLKVVIKLHLLFQIETKRLSCDY